MDDFFSLLLWSCLGLLALAIFIWVFVLQKSLRRLILAFIGALLGRDNRVDPDAPIQTAPPGTRVSEILQARAREAQQQPLGVEPLPAASADPLAPPSVPPPPMPAAQPTMPQPPMPAAQPITPSAPSASTALPLPPLPAAPAAPDNAPPPDDLPGMPPPPPTLPR